MEFTERRKHWKKINTLTPQKLELAHHLLNQIRQGQDVMELIRHHPLPEGGYLNKAALVAAYNEMVAMGTIQPDVALLDRIRMKPMRTLSGVVDMPTYGPGLWNQNSVEA
jgi:elongator complex protein 3